MEHDVLKHLPSWALSGLSLGSTFLSPRMIDISRERVGMCMCRWEQKGSSPRKPEAIREPECV